MFCGRRGTRCCWAARCCNIATNPATPGRCWRGARTRTRLGARADPELPRPPATAELRSAWTGEGARPHTNASVKLIMNDRADLCLAAGLTACMSGRMICLPRRRGRSSAARWLGVSTHNPEQLAEADQNFRRLPGHWPDLRDLQQGQSRSGCGARRASPGKGTDAQAAGCDRRHYPRQRPLRHRCRGRLGGGDIRLVTGSAQISRGIFEGIEVKLDLARHSPSRRARAPLHSDALRRFVSTNVPPPASESHSREAAIGSGTLIRTKS